MKKMVLNKRVIKHLINSISVFLFLVGIFLLIGSEENITGNFIGITLFSNLSNIGILFILGSLILFLANENLEDKICEVVGINPIDKSKTSKSSLYSKINERNLDEIFQTSLSHKYKKEQIMGAKAIVYMASDGNYNVAFLTEAINTHHRHAAATLAKFIENKFLEESDKEKINKKADALYEGNSDKSCELLTQCAGFELQYDKNLKKIIGIQQDSWITKEQQRCSRKPSLQVEEDMIIELLTHIDQKLLSEKLKNLEEEDFKKLYSGKKVA